MWHEVLFIGLVFWAAYSWARPALLTALGATIATAGVALSFTWSWTDIGLVLVAAAVGAGVGVWVYEFGK